MTEKTTHWTKTELKVYILLVCAKADAIATNEEIDLVRSKTDAATFDKMSKESARDNEEASLKRIRENLDWHHSENRELVQLRKEMNEVFLVDKSFNRKERSMDDISGNILY